MLSEDDVAPTSPAAGNLAAAPAVIVPDLELEVGQFVVVCLVSDTTYTAGEVVEIFNERPGNGFVKRFEVCYAGAALFIEFDAKGRGEHGDYEIVPPDKIAPLKHADGCVVAVGDRLDPRRYPRVWITGDLGERGPLLEQLEALGATRVLDGAEGAKLLEGGEVPFDVLLCGTSAEPWMMLLAGETRCVKLELASSPPSFVVAGRQWRWALASPAESPAAPPPGSRVETLFDGDTWYPGKIVERLGPDLARVKYDDGDEDTVAFPDMEVKVTAVAESLAEPTYAADVRNHVIQAGRPRLPVAGPRQQQSSDISNKAKQFAADAIAAARLPSDAVAAARDTHEKAADADETAAFDPWPAATEAADARPAMPETPGEVIDEDEGRHVHAKHDRDEADEARLKRRDVAAVPPAAKLRGVPKLRPGR